MASKFNRALRRYLNNEMAPQDRAAFEQWLDSLSTEEEEANVEWPDEQKTALLEKIKNTMRQPETHTQPTFKPAQRWLKVAASVAVVAVASWLIIPRVLNPVETNTPLSAEDVRKNILADGTLVWLRADSRITYREEANERHATLTGDALLEVSKNAARPFIISCGDIRVKVVGTSFSLRSKPDTLMLTVLTGKVKVYSASDTTSVNVLPNEKLVYINRGPVKKETAQHADVPAYFRATEYAMTFTRATLGEVFSRIEKKFNQTIRVDNEAVKRCTITADFTDQSLTATLNMIAQVHGITFTQQGSVITVSGEGCLP